MWKLAPKEVQAKLNDYADYDNLIERIVSLLADDSDVNCVSG